MQQLREALCTRLDALGFLEQAWPYEPETLGPLPCSALVLRLLEPTETATGPRLDVAWTYDLRLYVGLSDWVEAQARLDELIPPVLDLWRDDPTLGDVCEWWNVRDLGELPDFNTREHWLRKTLLVRFRVESASTQFR